MPVIFNTNYAATLAANNLAASSAAQQRSLNRLSSGSRIVNPSDDAGGLAVSMKFTAAARRMAATSTNLSNTTSLLQSQDGAMEVVGKILNRMGELKTLATDPTKNSSDIANYNAEFLQLQQQVSDIGRETFNGIGLFGSTATSVATSEDQTQTLSLQGANLLGTDPLFTTLTDNFSNLNNWNNVSSGGGSAYLNGNSLVLYGGVTGDGAVSSKESFTGAFQLTMGLNITGGSHFFSMSVGGTNILSANSFSNAGDNAVSISYDGVNTVTTTLNGVTSTQNVGALSGSLRMDNTPNGNATITNFQIASTNGTGNVNTLLAASSLSSVNLSSITGALQDVATYRAQNGAYQSRIGNAIDLLTTNEANLGQANSRISDVDVAQESTTLAKTTALVQAGTSMLLQANQSDQIALRLIGG